MMIGLATRAEGPSLAIRPTSPGSLPAPACAARGHPRRRPGAEAGRGHLAGQGHLRPLPGAAAGPRPARRRGVLFLPPHHPQPRGVPGRALHRIYGVFRAPHAGRHPQHRRLLQRLA
jgi:hypothetical protein